MNLKNNLKKIFYFLFTNHLFLKLKINYIYSKKYLIILNLHRIGTIDNSSYQPMDSKIFNELLLFIKENFFLTTFDQIKEIKKTNKPLMILSFDDGYKDFIEYAVPILYKHKIKVNQNIIPNCIESQIPPFNVEAQDFIGKAPMELLIKLNIPGIKLNLEKENRIKLGQRVSNYIKNHSIEKQKELRRFILPQFQNFQEFNRTKMMNVDEIKQIYNNHEIGVHSYEHASMKYESDEYFENDLLLCKRYFKNIFNEDCKIYAFPNGSYKKQHLNKLNNYGFSTILLVDEIFSQPHSLYHKRFTFFAKNILEAKYRSLGGLKF